MRIAAPAMKLWLALGTHLPKTLQFHLDEEGEILETSEGARAKIVPH